LLPIAMPDSTANAPAREEVLDTGC
jgi:hypothetical protein